MLNLIFILFKIINVLNIKNYMCAVNIKIYKIIERYIKVIGFTHTTLLAFHGNINSFQLFLKGALFSYFWYEFYVFFG